MRFLVYFQRVHVEIDLVTFGASIFDAIVVSIQVTLEAVALRKHFLTYVTSKRLLTRVYARVLIEADQLSERLLARRTLVGFFARVNFLMLLQIAQLRKGLAAFLALERLLAIVRPLMDGQIATLRKLFRAIQAGKCFCDIVRFFIIIFLNIRIGNQLFSSRRMIIAI